MSSELQGRSDAITACDSGARCCCAPPASAPDTSSWEISRVAMADSCFRRSPITSNTEVPLLLCGVLAVFLPVVYTTASTQYFSSC